MLSSEQAEFYLEQGYLRISQMFTPEQMDALDRDLERLVAEWAHTSPGWSGPWRDVYMDEETEKASKLTAMHDLHLYSQACPRAAAEGAAPKVLSGDDLHGSILLGWGLGDDMPVSPSDATTLLALGQPEASPAAYWARARIRSSIWRVRCGVIPNIRSMSIS